MTRPLRLDCETRQSAEASLLAAFGCTATALHRFLTDPAHLEYFEANYLTLPDFDRFLFQRACAVLGDPTLPTEFCWFHGTRIPSGTTFEDGILTLGQVLPRLESALVATLQDHAAQQAVQAAFGRKGGFGFHFGNKLNSPVHGGPFAILVREVAEYANELGQHDYLRMPEIVEDLCEDVLLASGLDLLSVFQEEWLPVVVKFVAPAGDSGEFALAVALRYLRGCALVDKPDMGAVWCFDGENTAVPASSILRVDFVGVTEFVS